MNALRRLFSLIDSERSRWPITVALVVIGAALVISERLADKRYRR